MDQLQPIALEQTDRVNPLLRRQRIPGESYTLPSRGLLYEPGILAHDVQNGELHIYPMTAIDELVMKTPDKMFSGDAVRETFVRCIPQVLDPDKLFAKDVDYLLTALFKVSYGPSITVTYHHDCEDSHEHQYEVMLDTFLRGTLSLNPSTLDYKFKYDCHGQKVVFKPATFGDLVQLQQLQQQLNGIEISNEVRLQQLMYSISTVIGEVDGIKDRELIIEWLHSLPIQWLTALSKAVEEASDWGVTFDVELQCNDCGEVVKVPTNLNPVNFFI